MKWTIIFVVFLAVSLAKPLRKSRHRRPPHKCLPAPVVSGESTEASVFVSPTPSALLVSVSPSEAPSLAEVSSTVLASIPPSENPDPAEVPLTPRNEAILASEIPFIASSPAKESEQAVSVTTVISISEKNGDSESLIEAAAPNAVDFTQTELSVRTELPVSVERSAEPEDLSITTEAAAAKEEVSGSKLEESTVTEISSYVKLEESPGSTPAETESPIISDISKSEELTATTAVPAGTENLPVTIEALSITELPSSSEHSYVFGESFGTNPAETEWSGLNGKSEELTATTAVPADIEGLPVTTEPSIAEPKVFGITEPPSSVERSGESVESIGTTLGGTESSNVSENNYQPKNDAASTLIAPSESSASETPETFSPTSGRAGEVDESPIGHVVSENILLESEPTSVAPEIPSIVLIPSENLSSEAPLDVSVSPLSSTASSKNLETAEPNIEPKLLGDSNKNLITSSPPTKLRAPLKRFLTFTFFDHDASNTSLKHFLNYLKSLKK